MFAASEPVSIVCQDDLFDVALRTAYVDDKAFTYIVEEFTDTAFKIDGLVRVVIFSVTSHAKEFHISYFFGFSEQSDSASFSSHVNNTARQHQVSLSRPNYAPEVLPQLARGKEALVWSVMDLSGTHPIGGNIYIKAKEYFQNIHPNATPCTQVYRAHAIPTN